MKHHSLGCQSPRMSAHWQANLKSSRAFIHIKAGLRSRAPPSNLTECPGLHIPLLLPALGPRRVASFPPDRPRALPPLGRTLAIALIGESWQSVAWGRTLGESGLSFSVTLSCDAYRMAKRVTYRHNLILWLGDSVTNCILWLFSQFPFPNAPFYTVVLSDSMTGVIGFYDYFPSIWGEKATFLVLNYSSLRQLQLIMLAMLSKSGQTGGNLQL